MASLETWLFFVLLFLFIVVAFFILFRMIRKDKKKHSTPQDDWTLVDALDRIFPRYINNKPQIPYGYNKPFWLSRDKYI